MDYIIPVRWIHVMASTAWFGEVVVINFVLVPVLSHFEGDARKRFLGTVFPRVFRLASVLSATAVVTGGILFWRVSNGFDLGFMTQSRYGISLLIAATMATLLTLFHFFVEDRLARRVGIGNPDTSQEIVEDVHVKLKFLPRAGLGVITTIFFLMMFSLRAP